MKEVFKKFNLPTYIHNKSFAEASKAISKRFEGREDAESTATLKEMMGRLRDAQEYVKQMQAPPQAESPQQGASPINPMQNQKFFGGMMGGGSGGGAGAGAGMGAMGGQIGDTASGIGKGLMKEEDDTIIAGDPKDNKMIDDTKDAVAKATGPFGQIFRGAQKMGQGIGDSIGGDAGAVVADIFSPEESTMAVWKDKDANVGQKILGTVPGVGGVVAKNLADQKLSEQMRESAYAQTAEVDNRFQDGGLMGQGSGSPMIDPELIKKLKEAENKESGDLINKEAIDKAFAENEVVDNASKDGASLLKPGTIERTGSSVFGQAYGTYSDPKTGETKEGNLKDGNSKKKKNQGVGFSEALRYAPSAMNLAQLAALKKPKEEALSRINSRYKEQLTDEEALQNLVREQTSANREAIVDASGGSGAAARANLLANSLQGTKALSDAYMRGEDANRGERRAGQQFNLGVDQTNLGQSNLENDINAKNLGNYQTQKSKLLSAIGNDLGSIGKEQLFKKYPELMGSDYNWYGKYLAEKKKNEGK